MNLTPKQVAAISALILAFTGTAVGVHQSLKSGPSPSFSTGTTTTTSSSVDAGYTGYCGVERHNVKDLLDNFTPPTPVPTTVNALTHEVAPPVTQDSPRLAAEQQTFIVQAKLIAVKAESDSDIHIIIADPSTGAQMNVESPAVQCVGSSADSKELIAARESFVLACGFPNSSGYVNLSGDASITGVRFFDVLHGQRGADNGVELHPLLNFMSSNCQQH